MKRLDWQSIPYLQLHHARHAQSVTTNSENRACIRGIDRANVALAAVETMGAGNLLKILKKTFANKFERLDEKTNCCSFFSINSSIIIALFISTETVDITFQIDLRKY